MIEIRVLGQYWGANPIRPWPVAILQIAGNNEQICKALEKKSQQRIRESFRSLKGAYKLMNCFKHFQASDGDPANTSSNNPENKAPVGSEIKTIDASMHEGRVKTFLLDWIEVLQDRAGMLCLEKPQHYQIENEIEKSSRNSLKLRVIVDMAYGSLQDLVEGLKWSAALWHWAVGDGQANLGRQLIAAAPPLRYAPKPSFRAMAKSAVELKLDWHYESLLFDVPMLVISRGAGLKRISQKVTDHTSGWGMQISKNKITTTRLLAGAGCPIAAGAAVNTLQEAIAIAEKLAYPVVTKPAGEDQAKGVVTGIQNREQLLKAFRRSEAAGKPVLVQRHIPGKDFRFYVVQGQLLAALERIPPVVIGDNKTPIRDLITTVNQERIKNYIRVEGDQDIQLSSIEISTEMKHALNVQELSLESIPAEGQIVKLHPTANFSVGGTVRECLQEVHPYNRRLLEKIARMCRLDIAGIDVIASTMKDPLPQTGGVICEVNGLPGVLPHQLAEPKRRLMAESLALLIGGRPQPPLVAMVGGPSTPAIIAKLEKVLSAHFEQLAVVDRRGWRQGGVIWSQEDGRNFGSQRRALRDVDADAFIMEIEIESLTTHGLPWTQTDVLVLLPDSPPISPGWQKFLKENAKSTITPSNDELSSAQEIVALLLNLEKQGAAIHPGKCGNNT